MVSRSRAAVLAVAVLAMPLLSGCLDAMAEYKAFDPDEHYRNPVVWPGEYKFGNQGSIVLQRGPYDAMPAEAVYLTSDRPAHAVDGGSPSTVVIPMAIWRPANVTEKVPIIIDAGPYYEQDETCGAEGDSECRITDMQQTTAWLVGQFLPHGYAVVQLAVRGTGTAGGCMDLLGDDETADLVQAIDWLATQEWANGNVAMIGASYDGSTQWSVAATGNEHLKAIVPTASLPDIFDLMFHNGSSEQRGATMHSSTYWGFGFDDDFPQNPGLPPGVPWLPPAGLGGANGRTMQQDTQNLCPSALTGTAMGPYAYATGDRGEQATDYWTQRDHRQGVLDNYKGAVFLIHGLQDWNVEPHSTIPYNLALREAGIDTREWYGQWGHAFPDSSCAQGAPTWVTLPCRIDFAEVLLHWFDLHLKGLETGHIGPRIQVQDSIGFWRHTDAWPDGAWNELRLSGDGTLRAQVEDEVAVQLDPPMQGAPTKIVELKTDALEADTRIAGLPQIKLPFQVNGEGGELAAWLFDEAPDGKVRAVTAGKDGNNWVAATGITPIVGHASLNLRYYAGGEESQVLQPNTRYTAQIEFEPMEVLVPAGHRLTLWVFQYAYGEHAGTNQVMGPQGPAVTAPASVTVYLGPDAVLRLPVVETDWTKVFPVPGSHLPQRDNQTLMYVDKPSITAQQPALLQDGAATVAAQGTVGTPTDQAVAAACTRVEAC